MMDLNDAIQKIKAAGANNVRAVPMPGQNVVSGKYQIEIKEGGSWGVVVNGATKALAEGIIHQATNRVICG